MEYFKRNQVEEAIAAFEEAAERSASELKPRIKRLLETDRKLGRSSRSADPERANFAFFSEEPQGTGVDVDFSLYEAFAILVGLRMLAFGWPQATTVSVLRILRPDLEAQHGRILKQDPARLFDAEEVLRRASPGSMAVGVTDPVFLCIFAGNEPTPGGRDKPGLFQVCKGEEGLFRFVSKARKIGLMAWSTFELAGAAHQLSWHLSKTEPRKRGHGSG